MFRIGNPLPGSQPNLYAHNKCVMLTFNCSAKCMFRHTKCSGSELQVRGEFCGNFEAILPKARNVVSLRIKHCGIENERHVLLFPIRDFLRGSTCTKLSSGCLTLK